MANFAAPSATAAVWHPPPDLSMLQIERFRHFVNTTSGVQLQTYDDLHHFSISRANDFWLLLWRYLDIQCSVSPDVAVDESMAIDKRPKWFAGARLNYAENVLSRSSSALALIALDEQSIGDVDEDGAGGQRLTWDHLRERTIALGAALLRAGVVSRSVVAYVGSNTVSAVVALLATAAVGAIFTSLAGDMGEESIVARLVQVKPVVIFAEAAYRYNGKPHVIWAKMSRVVLSLRRTNPGASHAILVPGRSNTIQHDAIPEVTACRWVMLDDFLLNIHRDKSITRFTYAQVQFDHPMLILFSSGTTGAPKGIVHSHGGVLINLSKEHILHENMEPLDVYYHYTNIGWTMWNIFLGGLLSGATLVLYDGSPFYPSPSRHLRAILDIGTTVFGGSPRYYDELQRHGIVPKHDMNIAKLRLLGNTGANLPTSLWSSLANNFGGKPIFSFSGGTEICGSFIHGTLTKPHFAGEITVPALGVDVAALDLDGNLCIGDASGELVCRRAIPNAAIGFWSDPDGSRYHNAYFSQYPGVWTQGDFCRISAKTGGIIMLGRSDGTLNPSGVRFGSAEIYSIIDKDFRNTVVDSLCVGRRQADGHEEVYLFLQLLPGLALSQALTTRISTRIAEVLSRRHVPHHIRQIPKVPCNVNGKKLEIPVKLIISGGDVEGKVRVGLKDQSELDYFRRFVDEKRGCARL